MAPAAASTEVKCVESGCKHPARGVDIERAYDKKSNPIYVIYYVCSEGHEFAIETERGKALVADTSMGD